MEAVHDFADKVDFILDQVKSTLIKLSFSAIKSYFSCYDRAMNKRRTMRRGKIKPIAGKSSTGH